MPSKALNHFINKVNCTPTWTTTAWTDIDARAFGVPNDATGVVLEILASSSNSKFYCYVDKKAVSHAIDGTTRAGGIAVSGGNSPSFVSFSSLDVNGRLQVQKEVAGDTFTVYITGWFGPGTWWLSSIVDRTPASADTFLDVDITINAGANFGNVAAAIVKMTVTTSKGGSYNNKLRKNGSTYDRVLTMLDNTSQVFIVPVDSSDIFEAYMHAVVTAANRLYVMGYIVNGAGYTAVSDPSAAGYRKTLTTLGGILSSDLSSITGANGRLAVGIHDSYVAYQLASLFRHPAASEAAILGFYGTKTHVVGLNASSTLQYSLGVTASEFDVWGICDILDPVSPFAIAAGGGRGTPVLAGAMSPSAIAAGGGRGTPVLAGAMSPSAIAAGGGRGTPVLAGALSPGSSASTLVLGAGTLVGVTDPQGIASLLASGEPTLAAVLEAVAAAPTTAAGEPTIVALLVPQGAESSSAVGAATLVAALEAAGYSVTTDLGAPSMVAILAPVGVDGTSNAGEPLVAALIDVSAILSSLSFGTLVTVGVASPETIAALIAAGAPRLVEPFNSVVVVTASYIGATASDTESSLQASISSHEEAVYAEASNNLSMSATAVVSSLSAS